MLDNGQRNDVPTHAEVPESAGISQELTSDIKRLTLFIEETSDENKKVKAELSRMTDEIAHRRQNQPTLTDHLKERWNRKHATQTDEPFIKQEKPEGLENLTEPERETVSDVHPRPKRVADTHKIPCNRGENLVEEGLKGGVPPCGNGQGCRFLSKGKYKFWYSPRTVSIPGSGRFISSSEFPGTDTARTNPEGHTNLISKYQYQNNENHVINVISIPMGMVEFMTRVALRL